MQRSRRVGKMMHLDLLDEMEDMSEKVKHKPSTYIKPNSNMGVCFFIFLCFIFMVSSLVNYRLIN